jgi:hypothetical protein
VERGLFVDPNGQAIDFPNDSGTFVNGLYARKNRFKPELPEVLVADG